MKPSTYTICITYIDIQEEVIITTDVELKGPEFQDIEKGMNIMV